MSGAWRTAIAEMGDVISRAVVAWACIVMSFVTPDWRESGVWFVGALVLAVLAKRALYDVWMRRDW